MSTKKESIEWVTVADIVLGSNPRTVKPNKERVAEYARSIALYGILVPLIAEKKPDGYHLQAGYTRLAALEQLKGDKALSALAVMNNVDLERVPVRIYQGDEKGRLMLPIIENNFHDVMNEVDVAHQVRQLMEAGQDARSLEEFFGKPKFALLLSVLALPAEVQELIKADRIKASTAVKFAKEIPDPAKLLKALNKASDKVEELYKSGRRKNKRITEGVLKGKQTPMKVVNDVAAGLKRTKLEGSDLLLNFLHGLQSGMDAETLLEALAKGEEIPAPPVKKRGRKKKERPAGEEAAVKVPGKRGRKRKVEGQEP
ncbi:MAG: ParB N-terminal domain-containing protein [Flavobacteriales bacterium]|nr:ParB N-terminal domain-containing protein [Flavobacteriales bacterium]